MHEERDLDPKPPILLCCLIALAALAVGGGAILFHHERPVGAMAEQLTSLPRDLSQVIRLKEVYSHPPEPEDPSKYPTFDSRKPAQSTRQKSPSDTRAVSLRSL